MGKTNPTLDNYITAENTFTKDLGMGGYIRRNGFDGVIDGVKYIAKHYMEFNKLDGNTHLLNTTGSLLNWLYKTAVDIRTEVPPSRWSTFIFNEYLDDGYSETLEIDYSEKMIGIREVKWSIEQSKRFDVRIIPWNTDDHDLMYIIRLMVDKMINDIHVIKKTSTKVS